MGVDWFVAGSCEMASDVPLDKMAELSRLAEDYLRVGRGLSWAEWTALGIQSRAAFLDAANRLQVERAGIQAVANQSMAAALETLAQVDGGKAKLAAAMARVTAQATAKLEATTFEQA
jgi:hypothetical protein